MNAPEVPDRPSLRPTLDARLEAVLELIRADTHADIGTDHARLPIRLVREGRVGHCVAVELNDGPFALAQRMVARARLTEQIDVRQGDGFGPLAADEVESVSIAGMGAYTIRGILERAGEKLPPVLVLQPNDSPRWLRLWARERGYHIVAERLLPGYWAYPVLRLERAGGTDPAYAGLPDDAALRYGPLLLREGGDLLRAQIEADQARLLPVAAPGRESWQELAEAQVALGLLPETKAPAPPSRCSRTRC